MRRVALAALAATALSAGAIENVSAQDILGQMYSPVPMVNWTGFYIGANAGYGWSKVNSSASSTISSAASSYTMKGMIAGGQLGMNLQFSGPWVIGIESDIQASWQKFDGPGNGVNLYGALGLPGLALNETDSMQWFGTTRARIGVAADRVLVYGTGGVAYGNIHTNAALSGITLVKDTSFRFGWVAGGGVEAMLSRNWTVKAEYLHMDFGGYTDQFIQTSTGTILDLHLRMTDDVVRVGVNYMFR